MHKQNAQKICKAFSSLLFLQHNKAKLLSTSSVSCRCRYVAVCEPLRYPTIMTPARLHACCALAWIAALLCIIPLFAFHSNVPLCGNILPHVYCSNRAILSLACHPTPINNIYGQYTL